MVNLAISFSFRLYRYCFFLRQIVKYRVAFSFFEVSNCLTFFFLVAWLSVYLWFFPPKCSTSLPHAISNIFHVLRYITSILYPEDFLLNPFFFPSSKLDSLSRIVAQLLFWDFLSWSLFWVPVFFNTISSSVLVYSIVLLEYIFQ